MNKKLFENENTKLISVSTEPLLVEKELELKEKNNSKFRIRSKRFFLTYPNLPTIDNLSNLFLDSLKNSFDVKNSSSWEYLIAEEKHQDGTPHVHVYLSFSAPQGVYSRDKLTVVLNADGKEQKCEGRYESVKNHHHVIQYVLKSTSDEDSLLTNMILPIVMGTYYSEPAAHLHAVLRTFGLKTAIRTLMTEYPRLVIEKGNTLISNLETAAQHFITEENQKRVVVRPLNDFENIPDDVRSWMTQSLRERRSLILYGPPGTGKTELAKSIFQEMGLEFILIRDMNILKGIALAINHGLLFDDFAISTLSREQIIHLLDTENMSGVRILYGYVQIPPNVTRIFTTNRIFEFNLMDEAIERRVKTIEIKEKLWSLKTTTTTTTQIITETTLSSTTATQGATNNDASKTSTSVSGMLMDAVIVENPKRKRGRPKKIENIEKINKKHTE